MLGFKEKLQQQSRKLLVKFSSVYTPHPVKLFKLKKSWGDFINDYSNVSVACDMTFKTNQKYWCPLSNRFKWEYITESLAYANVINFANRINYKIYKNAYKRYGKKLDMVSVIEGGRKELRTRSKEDKKLHAHIAISLPTTMNFAEFKNAVHQCWTDTYWGNFNNKITQLQSKSAYANYQVKDNLDSLVLPATNLSLSWEL